MNPSMKPSFGDLVLMAVITGGIFLVYLAGGYIYVYSRTFIRRFIKKMPDWAEF